jgi:hypothetical protein
MASRCAKSREVQVNVMWCFAGDLTPIDNWAHELCHAACGMQDIYGYACRGLDLSLASCTAGGTAPTRLRHLDPWHKIRMGWVKPHIYDLRDFPAGAFVLPTQSPAERPIILFDSSRGSREFHILEHRNGEYTQGTTTWTAAGGPWRAQARSSYPSAGYDIDVRSSDGNRSGFVTWSVKTDAANNLLDIPQAVMPGTNGALNSTRLGDDTLWPLTAPTQIHPGPDGILQTALGGDDSYAQDALCLPIPNPADLPFRLSWPLVPTGAAATTLRYYNSDDTGVLVRGGDTDEPLEGQYLEWGRAFRPFISGAHPTKVYPQSFIQLTGSLGERRFSPELLLEKGQRVALSSNSWRGTTASVRLPNTYAPPGRHRLVIFDSPLKEASSNAWPITVGERCEIWATSFFNNADILAGKAADDADPDRDGQPNLVEMIMGTNPVIPT